MSTRRNVMLVFDGVCHNGSSHNHEPANKPVAADLIRSVLPAHETSYIFPLMTVSGALFILLLADVRRENNDVNFILQQAELWAKQTKAGIKQL